MATLAEQHRQQQDAISRILVQQITRSWTQTMKGVPTPSLSEQWIASVLAFVIDARNRSEGAAALYYGLERFDQAPDLPAFRGGKADVLDDEAIFTSLDVTGRVRVLQALEESKHTEPEALALAGTSVAGAADRLALNGGRSYWLNAHQEDRYSLAYYRNPRTGCCSFCAMLASRGAVYREDSFADSDPRFFGPGDAKVHDQCHCTMGSVWRADAGVPDLNISLGSLWETSTNGLSGQDAQRAFRNAYESMYGRRD